MPHIDDLSDKLKEAKWHLVTMIHPYVGDAEWFMQGRGPVVSNTLVVNQSLAHLVPEFNTQTDLRDDPASGAQVYYAYSYCTALCTVGPTQQTATLLGNIVTVKRFWQRLVAFRLHTLFIATAIYLRDLAFRQPANPVNDRLSTIIVQMLQTVNECAVELVCAMLFVTAPCFAPKVLAFLKTATIDSGVRVQCAPKDVISTRAATYMVAFLASAVKVGRAEEMCVFLDKMRADLFQSLEWQVMNPTYAVVWQNWYANLLNIAKAASKGQVDYWCELVNARASEWTGIDPAVFHAYVAVYYAKIVSILLDNQVKRRLVMAYQQPVESTRRSAVYNCVLSSLYSVRVNVHAGEWIIRAIAVHFTESLLQYRPGGIALPILYYRGQTFPQSHERVVNDMNAALISRDEMASKRLSVDAAAGIHAYFTQKVIADATKTASAFGLGSALAKWEKSGDLPSMNECSPAAITIMQYLSVRHAFEGKQIAKAEVRQKLRGGIAPQQTVWFAFNYSNSGGQMPSSSVQMESSDSPRGKNAAAGAYINGNEVQAFLDWASKGV